MTNGTQAKPLTRADIPSWMRVDSEGRIWTTHARRGGSTVAERRAELLHNAGYLTVRLPRGKFLAHRVVYAAVHGEAPADLFVRHLNGVRTDNRPENLAAGTQVENMADARRHGTMVMGERARHAKLDAVAVANIRTRAAAGESRFDLAEEYGVHPAHIWNIVNRLTWKHI